LSEELTLIILQKPIKKSKYLKVSYLPLKKGDDLVVVGFPNK
jgi:hypothetical protein